MGSNRQFVYRHECRREALRVSGRRAPELNGIVGEAKLSRNSILVEHHAPIRRSENGLQPARHIASEQADRPGRRDGNQMTVTDALFSDIAADFFRQTTNERSLKIFVAVEIGKAAFLLAKHP